MDWRGYPEGMFSARKGISSPGPGCLEGIPPGVSRAGGLTPQEDKQENCGNESMFQPMDKAVQEGE